MEILAPVFEAIAFLLEAAVWVTLATIILLIVGIAPIHFEKITIICANKDSYEEVLSRYGIVLDEDEDDL